MVVEIQMRQRHNDHGKLILSQQSQIEPYKKIEMVQSRVITMQQSRRFDANAEEC